MAYSDYNKAKPCEVTSTNDSGSTISKAQPIVLSQGAKLTGTIKSEADSGSTTLSTSEFATVLSLKEDALVTTVGFESNDDTDVNIKIERNSDNKVLAEKTVTPVAESFTEVSFTVDDYSVFPDSGDTVNVIMSETGTASLRLNESGTRTNTLFDITNNDTTSDVEGIAGTQNSNGGTAIECETYDPSDAKTGTGDIVLDWSNISSKSDIAVYDENDSLLDFEVENLDVSNETGVLWVYNDWVRDDTVQAQIVYGNGPSSTEENVTGTWDNTGQSANMIQHFNNDANDSTSNNNDGTITGATFTSNGQINGAYSLDGLDDAIEVPDSSTVDFNPEVEDYSVALWVKTSNPDGDIDYLLSKRGNSLENNDISYEFELNSDGTVEARVQEDSVASAIRSISTSSIDDGNWHRVVLEHDVDNTSLHIYIDGTQENTEDTSNITDNVTTDFSLKIGARDRGDDTLERHLNGEIDELNLYATNKGSVFWQADYDASPKANQVFFSQQAATTQKGTISTPENQLTQTTENPTLSPGNSRLQVTTTEITQTTENPNLNAVTSITVNETVLTSSNPDPAVNSGQTIITPETQLTQITVNPTVTPNTAPLNIPETQLKQTTEPIALNRQVLVGIATQLNAENPDPSINSGAVSVQVNETTLTQSVEPLSLNPGNTDVQVTPPTNLTSTNPEFSVVGGNISLSIEPTSLVVSTEDVALQIDISPRSQSRTFNIDKVENIDVSGDINK